MLTGMKIKELTAESVAATLATLENDYRRKAKTLRALLAALKAEGGEEEDKGDD